MYSGGCKSGPDDRHAQCHKWSDFRLSQVDYLILNSTAVWYLIGCKYCYHKYDEDADLWYKKEQGGTHTHNLPLLQKWCLLFACIIIIIIRTLPCTFPVYP